MSLGDILTKYFGCKHPFLKNPVRENVGGDFERTRYITRNGDKAYGELVGLIYDLAELLPDTFDANEIIEQLDQIVDGDSPY